VVYAKPADYVFANGKIYTVNEKQPWAEALAVKGNKIVYVGDAAGVAAYQGEGTEVIDLGGKMLLPGFISAHDHLIASSWTSAGVNLFDAKTKKEYLKLIKEYAEAHPDDKVIRGIGWNVENMGGVYPTAKELDAAVPDRPAFILDYTIHDGWLNTAALKAGNITKDTPDLLPGTTYWRRDKEGTPTGVAMEIQWMGAYVDAGAWEPEKMMRESTEKLFSIAAANGTTALLNPGVVTPNIKDTHGGMETDFKAAMAMLTELDKEGKLLLRVQALPMFKSATADPARFVAFAKEMSEQYNSDRLSVRSVKVHPEGNAVARAAPFLEPYIGTDNKGSFNVKPEVSREIVLLANKAGLDVMIHTDGDASSRAVVDAFEAAFKAGYKDNRNAIHHAQWIHPDDQQRIIDMKIPINATPSFFTDWSGQDAQFTELLGEERVKTSLGRYPDFSRAGNRVSISADVPSTMPDMQAPLFCVEAAVTMMEPSSPGSSKPFPPGLQGMTVEQAIRAVTIDAAWQLRMDDKIGSLEVGKYADLVVLEKNPFEVDPLQIEEIHVLMTMMDGKFTYQGTGDEYEDGVPDRDEYLTPAEFTPKVSQSQPKENEKKAMLAAMKFARLFCCGSGHAGAHHVHSSESIH
jgi:hypothetical protein